MPYLARFDYDIFLSHGWSGNLNENEGDRRWTNDLKTKLEIELNERLRDRVSIFLDVESPRNGDTENLFRHYVRRSAIFLPIVTPAFCLEGSFCRRELDWFHDESRPISTFPIDIDRRVFKIESRPVPRQRQPEKIRNHSPYTFFEGDPGPSFQDYRLLAMGSVDSDSRSRISTEFGRLAPALATFLDRCRQDQANFPVRTVFLAETSAAEKVQVLHEIGAHEIISLSPSPGMSEADFDAKTEHILASSDCSIHLIDTSKPLAPPPNWQRSVAELQLLCAQRIRKANFTALVWCDGARPIEDLRLKELMIRTQNEFTNSGPMRHIPQGIQYFTSNLPAMLTQEFRREDAFPSIPLGKRVFVQCMKNDIEKLEPAFQKLNSLGINVQLPVFDGRHADKDRLTRRFLSTTDGTLIYWGSGGDATTYMLCDKAVEVYGSDLNNKKRLIGIDPPQDIRRRRFMHPSFRTMPFPADAEQLSEQQLRAAFL
jgi:hypothetical protein